MSVPSPSPVRYIINPAATARLSPSEIAARDELAALLAAPCLSGDDLRRLPILAAALGVALRVRRVDWGQGVDGLSRAERVIGEVRA